MNTDKYTLKRNFEGDDIIYFNYNYFIKGGRAYTEDHVLVHKIFVYKIPRKATAEEIFNYFSRFGNVLNVHFIGDKRRYRNNTTPKVGFVHFQFPESAARVLKCEKHILLNKRILVKACDSWHQPDAVAALNIDSSSSSNTPKREAPVSLSDNARNNPDDKPGTSKQAKSNATTESDADTDVNYPEALSSESILILNDYCLENIMRRLNLRDQVRFARTCSRFRQVFEMSSKMLHRKLHLDRLDNMTLWEIRDFFDYAGDNITCVEGEFPEKYRERIVEFMGIHCKNIDRLALETTELRQKTINKLFGCLPKLTHLRLNYCSLNDSSLLPLRKLKELKSLILSDNFDLTGKHLNSLSPTIESLKLNSCCSLESRHIVSFCRSLSNLRELDLEQCYCLSTHVYQAMVGACKNLETLKVSANSSEYELVANLPKLKSLTLYTATANNEIRSALFTKLAELKADQLEYLHLVGKNLVDDRVAEKISQLRALRTFICPYNEDLGERGLEALGNLKNLEEIVLKDCVNITDIGLLRLVINCHKLKRVHLQRCAKVSDNLIYDAIRKMRHQIKNKTFERQVPVTFLVENTKISEFILNDPEYVAAGDLVTVFFKNAPPDLLKYDDFYFPPAYDSDDFFDFEAPEVVDLDIEVDDDSDYTDDDDVFRYFAHEFIYSDDDYDEEDFWRPAGLDNLLPDNNNRNNHYLFFIN